MSLDPRLHDQDDIPGIQQAATVGVDATLFELACDGEGCATSVRAPSEEIVARAYRTGLTTAASIQDFVLKEMRHKAYSAGWVVGRGHPPRDYCPRCTMQGRARGGDMIRKGAGRRKAKR